MKKVTLFICSLLFVFAINAQEKIMSYYIGPVVSLPVGDFGNAAGLGFGGEIQADYPFSSKVEGFGQGGFQSYSAKSINGVSQKAFATPTLTLGARYIINKFSVGLGVNYSSYMAKYTEDGVGLSPQIGVKIKSFNIILHYTQTYVSGAAFGSSHFNSFGLKLFYRLSDIFENQKN